MNTTLLRDALQSAQRAGLDRLDAQMLLLHCLGRNVNARAWLMAHDDEPVDTDQQIRYTQLCNRRLSGEPLAYLVGQKEFFGMNLKVDPRVLVPRPDTETLVRWALETMHEPHAKKRAPLRVLDLGTGSGAIGLAVKASEPASDVWASDASADALAVAQSNAQLLNLPINFRQGRWWDAVPGERFALILSNPPYIEPGDPHLDNLRHEPTSALVSGPDGLSDLRQLVQGARGHLQPGGWLLLEHGHDQAGQVRAMLQQAGFAHVASRKDLAGIERCSGGQWPEKP